MPTILSFLSMHLFVSKLSELTNKYLMHILFCVHFGKKYSYAHAKTLMTGHWSFWVWSLKGRLYVTKRDQFSRSALRTWSLSVVIIYMLCRVVIVYFSAVSVRQNGCSGNNAKEKFWQIARNSILWWRFKLFSDNMFK